MHLHWESVPKIIHKWYYTSNSLAQIFSNHSPQCWRNCGSIGSLVHILWDCLLLIDFCQRFSINIQYYWYHVCLWPHVSTSGSKHWGLASKFYTVITYFLVDAKLSIARNWMLANPPLLHTSIQILNDHAHLKYMFSGANFTHNAFQYLRPWLQIPNWLKMFYTVVCLYTL